MDRTPPQARAESPLGATARFTVLLLELYLGLLLFFPQAFGSWPLRSHYYYLDKGALRRPLAMLPLVCVAGGLLALARRLSRGGRYAALALMLFALALQWSFSFVGDSLSARRISSTLLSPVYGHSEFVTLAWAEEDPLALARDYEERCAHDPRFLYAKSKPPGQLLFYTLAAQAYKHLPLSAACERLAHAGGFFAREPVTGFGVFTAFLFSLLASLTIPVLYLCGSAAAVNNVHCPTSNVGERLIPLKSQISNFKSLGAWSALAYLLCPAALLMTMHMDQVLYPLITATALLFAITAVRRAAWGFAAGLAAYLGLYVSFSLVFLIPTVFLVWGCHFLLRPGARRPVALAGACFAAGLALSHFFFQEFLGFQLLQAYARSMENHLAWRGVKGLVGVRGTCRNFVELALAMGLPAAVACAAAWIEPLRRRFRYMDPWDLFTLAYPALLLAISVFGHTIHEIGRLWIPLMAPLALAAARRLCAVYGAYPRLYVALGLLMVFLFKNYTDF